MKILDILKAIAEPFRPPTAMPLRLMADAELAEHVAVIEARIVEGETTLTTVNVQLAEAAAEAFANGESAIVTQNAKAVEKAKTTLDGLRTTLRGLRLEQERRAEVSAAQREREARQARIAAYEAVAKLIPPALKSIAGLDALVELFAAVEHYNALMANLPEGRRDLHERPQRFGRQVDIEMAIATHTRYGGWSPYTTRWHAEHPDGTDQSQRPRLAEFWATYRAAIAEDIAAEAAETTAAKAA